MMRNIKMIAPLIWPKERLELQLRVVTCILLVIVGRVATVYVPLYSAKIGIYLLNSNFWSRVKLYVVGTIRAISESSSKSFCFYAAIRHHCFLISTIFFFYNNMGALSRGSGGTRTLVKIIWTSNLVKIIIIIIIINIVVYEIKKCVVLILYLRVPNDKFDYILFTIIFFLSLLKFMK